MRRRRGLVPTEILSVRLLPEQKRYLELAAEHESAQMLKMGFGAQISVSGFVRSAAFERAERKLGLSAADFVAGRDQKRTRAR